MSDKTKYYQRQRKMEADWDAKRRREDGWTILRRDFSWWRGSLWMGEAIKELQRLSGLRLFFWRHVDPGMGFGHADGRAPICQFHRFSTRPDVKDAKLVEAALLMGMGDYRAMMSKDFNDEMAILRGLFMAPPSVGREDWLALKATLAPFSLAALDRYGDKLRERILGANATLRS